MKLCINSEAVFNQVDFYEGIYEAAKHGIKTIEIWKWWDKDLDRLEQIKKDLDIVLEGMCTPFISLVDASCHENYLDNLRKTIEVATRFGSKFIISQTGNDTGDDREIQKQNMVCCLNEAANLLKDTNITLVVEPLNIRVDHPGYFLVKSEEAFEVIDKVNSPYIKVLFDIYHQQISEGDVLRNIIPNIDKIGHFHVAGSDGRNELQFGELNYQYVFERIADTGYSGCIGLEYFPRLNPSIGLSYVMERI